MTKSRRIAIATCRVLPEPDPDHEPLVQALRASGVESCSLAWDDPGSLESAPPCDACIIRSTWNYYLDAPAFLHWITRASGIMPVLNRPELVCWNIHKRYLRELEGRGVPIVPTLWSEGRPDDAINGFEQHNWPEVVIKPCISAASYRTRRFTLKQRLEASAFARDLNDRGIDFMIQPYLRSVELRDDRRGERSLIWIDGRTTHVIQKSPRFFGQDESVRRGADPTDDERGIASAAIGALPMAPLYARVDLMQDDAGRPLLSELELIEPSLFFPQCPEALVAFVDALLRRL